MTIKKFAALCGCNPQTLRYYDRVDLLKPARVDRFSGYRFYEEEQALTFVKIKNLQSAGFPIEEIKALLPADNAAICEAFAQKIREQEAHLQKIRTIQQAYRSEMSEMQNKLEQIRKQIQETMAAYDPEPEFGIDAGTYQKIVQNVQDAFSWIDDTSFALPDIPECEPAQAPQSLEQLHDPLCETVFARHGWQNAKDFLDALPAFKDGGEYVLCFAMTEEKVKNLAFHNTLLNLLLERNPGKKLSLSCSTVTTEDGQNHFWLLRKRTA